jgi:hypothetical protein
MAGEAAVKGNRVDIDTTIADLFTETDFVFVLSAEMEAWYQQKWGLAFNGQWTVLEQDDNLKGTPLEFDRKNAASVSQSKTWADPILGSRSIVRFGEDKRWRGILRGDFGGFGAGSTFTWNLVGMLGYDFAMGSVDTTVLLGMRALSQDFADGSGSNRFKWDVIQYGPLVGLAFRF